MNTPSDQYDEAEAAREAAIATANQDSSQFLWDHTSMEGDWVEGTLVSIKPDLFLWYDYQATGESEDPDATYINLNQVVQVSTFNESVDETVRFLKVTLGDGSSLKTTDEHTIDHFWEQWNLI